MENRFRQIKRIGLMLVLILSFHPSFFGQNPGNIGAANLTAWFKPDALPLGNATSWPTTLSSIGGVTLTDAFAPFPQVTQTPPGNISNYNKTLFFNNNGPTSLQLLSNPVAGINLMQNNVVGGQGTFFAAYYLPSGSPTSGTLLQWNNVPNGLSVRNTGVLGQVSIGNQSGVSTNAGRTYSEGYVPTVMSVRGNRSTATSLNVFDNDFLSNNSFAAQSTGSQGVYIGYSPGNSTSGYNGYIHEYIFYNTNLTDAQMRRVHSYLAIKYGATLDNNGGGVQGDYTNSSGTVIWDASLNPTYHNNVIGIMRDDNQALLQKQSHSFNDSYRVYVSSLAASNAANTGVLAQNSSLVMGELFPQITFTCMLPSSSIAGGPTYVANRMEREWKVTNTAFNQPFNWDVRIDTCALPGFSVGSVNPANFRLLVDSDGDFSNCAVYQSSSSPIVFSYSNGYVSVTGINNSMIPVNSTAYVTIGYEPSPISFSGNDTICIGDSTQITVNLTIPGPINFTYSDGTSSTTLFNAVDGTTFFVAPTVTTTYTILGQSNGLSCCGSTATSSLTIVVQNSANISATASSNSICQGDSVQLTGFGGSTYIWDNGAVNGGFISPLATTIYKVIGTTSGGCVDSAFVTIQVNPIPTISIVTSADTICAGEAVILSISGAPVINWSNGIINAVSFTPISSAFYVATGTSSNGCFDTDSIQIVVNNLPNVQANTLDSSICLGFQATVFGSGANMYTWNNGITNNVAFSPTSSNQYTVVGIDSNGCENTDSIFISVNNPPTVTANASSTSICQGDSILIFGSGATSYVWNLGATDNDSISTVTDTTYTVIGTDLNGCQDTASIFINVANNPILAITASSDTICFGESIVLTASGTTNFSWNNGIANNVAFMPISSSFYAVTGTNANGCSETDSIFIVVHALPNVEANALDSSICLGFQATVFGSGALTYLWNNGVNNSIAFTPTATATYLLIGTDGNGCQNTDSLLITVNNPPIVTANANSSTICEGNSTLLFGSGATSYNWNFGATNNDSISPAVSTTYTVIGFDNNGCSDTASITINVTQKPNVSLSATSTVICVGEPVTLTGNGAVTYVWNNGVMNNVPFNPSATQTYNLIGIDLNACFDTASVQVVVNPLPNVVANSTDLTVCEGETITLFGSGALTYTWNNGISNGQTLTPTSAVIYTVTGIDANNCVNTDTIFIAFSPAIELSLGNDDSLCPQNPILLFTDQSFSSYNWNTGSTASQLSVNVPGTYTLTVQDVNGCIYSAQKTIILSQNCFPAVFIPNAFTPNADEFNNTLRTTGDQLNNFEINVFDRWGNLLFTSFDINEQWDGTFGNRPCPQGIYTYTVIYSTNSGTDEKFTLNGHVTLLR